MCVVHHADRWNTKDYCRQFAPWLENNRLSFLLLSSHTLEFFRDKGMTKWTPEVRAKAQQNLRSLAPVFPVDIPPLPPTSPQNMLSISTDKNKVQSISTPKPPSDMYFALQGNYEAHRRDFKTVFSNMKALANSHDPPPSPSDGLDEQQGNPHIYLQLLGSGQRPNVPDSIRKSIIFRDRLDYKPFYDYLSESLAMIPAFATLEYYDRKASSTVPASLIAGTPIISVKNLTDAYTYIGEDNVYQPKEGENDLDVMRRIIQMPWDERIEMQRKVRHRCNDLIQENIHTVGQWLKDIAQQLGK